MVQQLIMSRAAASASRSLGRAITTSAAATSSAVASTSSSSSSAVSVPSNRPRKSKKTARKHKRETDDILRRAIELYHLTPHFLPTPEAVTAEASLAPESSPSDWDTVLDQTIRGTIAESLRRNRAPILPQGLGEYHRLQAGLASKLPSFGKDETLERERRSKTSAFASAINETTFTTKQEREAADALAKASAPVSAKKTASSADSLSLFTDADIQMYHRRHSQASASGPNDTSMTSGADRSNSLERITPGSNGWYRNQGLDPRSARVRDAIFGTINGELPGLEVVRERVARMKKERNQMQES